MAAARLEVGEGYKLAVDTLALESDAERRSPGTLVRLGWICRGDLAVAERAL